MAIGSFTRARPRPARRAVESVVLAALIALGVLSVWQSRPRNEDSTVGPVTTNAISRPPINGSQRPPLAPEQQAAVERVAANNPTMTGAHPHSNPHPLGPATEVPVAAAEAAALAAGWSSAQAAATRYPSTAAAEAAGYVLASLTAPGVGVHYVNWELIARPFDAERPSMLLFYDGHLVGFSYWVESPTAPAGFAGLSDQWHAHSGLCIVNGWVEREEVENAADCPGTLLEGSNLWMLHAWVVPGYENRWGRFAVTNPKLCPSRARVSDLASCSPDQG